MAQWQGARLAIEGLRVRVAPQALHYVLQQDTQSSVKLHVQPRKIPDMTE